MAGVRVSPPAVLARPAWAGRPAPLLLLRPDFSRRGFAGVGALPPQAQSIASMAAAGASATGFLIGALAAIPIAGPIAAAIAGLGVAIANVFGGCGQTCVAATQIADQVGQILGDNLAKYLAAPVHYKSLQAAALNNFDTAWAALVRACGDPGLSDAGKRCISDRQAGSCKWQASPGGWTRNADGSWTYTAWGPAGSGSACWNWFIGMRDPIANDPTVVPDPSPVSGAGSSILSAVGLSPSVTVFGVPAADLVLPAVLIGAGMMM